VELQISPKRVQVHSAYRLEKFIDPKTSKFLNEEKRKKRWQMVRKQSSTQAIFLKVKKTYPKTKLMPESSNGLQGPSQSNLKRGKPPKPLG
jgi:hypothetical protein